MAGQHTSYHRHGDSYWRITSGQQNVTTASTPKSLVINVRLDTVPRRRYWWETLKRRFKG